MRPQLKFWRDLPKETKTSLMEKHGIKSITFKEIEKLYYEKIQM